MPTPAFILELRRKVGHDLLFLPGLVAVVFDDRGRLLLNRRSDSRRWSLISGIPEPGEQPEAAVEREVLEETGVRARAVRLVDASTSPVIEYPNGDRSQYLTVAYRCEVVGGEPRVADDESLEVRFFDRDEMPELRPDLARCVERARAG
jgi:ADP-ribose pyrophosphatase YjhB (NUDIX family)